MPRTAWVAASPSVRVRSAKGDDADHALVAVEHGQAADLMFGTSGVRLPPRHCLSKQ